MYVDRIESDALGLAAECAALKQENAALKASLAALKRKHEIEIRRLERQYAASQGDGAILRVRLADVERRTTR